jgi:hypothetical protein
MLDWSNCSYFLRISSHERSFNEGWLKEGTVYHKIDACGIQILKGQALEDY